MPREPINEAVIQELVEQEAVAQKQVEAAPGMILRMEIYFKI